jgi:hypothetical protein
MGGMGGLRGGPGMGGMRWRDDGSGPERRVRVHVERDSVGGHGPD